MILPRYAKETMFFVILMTIVKNSSLEITPTRLTYLTGFWVSQLFIAWGYPPPKHGYIRRLVKVKQPGASMYIDCPQVLVNKSILVDMDFSQLYDLTNPLYRIDPLNEKTTIYLRNLPPNTAMTKAPFVSIYPTSGAEPTEILAPLNSPTIRVYSEPDVPCSSYAPGCIMSDKSYVEIEEGFFKRFGLDEYSSYELI